MNANYKNMLARLPGKATYCRLKENMLRVDHAGETGAVTIYAGQASILKDSHTHRESYKSILEMKQGEEKHLAFFNDFLPHHKVRPSLLSPLWHVGGFVMGATTSFMSKNHAMLCTQAVEQVIGNHYQDQIDFFESHPDLIDSQHLEKIKQFRDEELEHLDHAVQKGSQEAGFYNLSKKIIQSLCRLSITIAQKI